MCILMYTLISCRLGLILTPKWKVNLTVFFCCFFLHINIRRLLFKTENKCHWSVSLLDKAFIFIGGNRCTTRAQRVHDQFAEYIKMQKILKEERVDFSILCKSSKQGPIAVIIWLFIKVGCTRKIDCLYTMMIVGNNTIHYLNTNTLLYICNGQT